MKRLSILMVLVALPHAGRAGPSVDRLLAHVPDEAGLIVVVPSVEKLVEGIAAFGKSIGVDDLAEVDGHRLLKELDLLDELEGLDAGGPLVLALAASQPSMPLLLCTVTDAEAWKRAVAAEQAEGGLYRIRMFGDYGFAALDGDVLIVGDDEESIRAALRPDGKLAERFGPRLGQWLATDQVVVGVRLPTWSPLLAPLLNAAQASVQMSMVMSGQQDEATMRLITWGFQQARELLDQIDLCTLGARIGEKGAFVRAAATVRPDGYLAGYLSKIRKTKAALLRGLAAEDSLFVLGCEWDRPPEMKSIGAMCMETMLATDALKARLGEEQFQKAYQATMAVQNELRGYNLSVTLGPPEQALVFSGLEFTQKPQALMENMRCAYEIDPEFMGTFGGGSTVDITWGSEEIGGVKAQVLEMHFQTEDEQARRLLETLYGEALTTRTAAQADGLAFATGPAEWARERLTQLLQGAGKQLINNDRVVAAQRAVSPNPQCLVLVDLAQCVTLGMRIAKTTGAPMPPFELPQKPTAFVSCAVYLDDTALRAELFVPAEPIKVVVAAAKAAKQRESGEE